MNREIKFRAWDTINNCMGYVKEISFYDHIVIYGIAKSSTDDNWTWQPVEYNDIILMQYTGLKDRNGVEIYEGDVVRVVDLEFGTLHIGEVAWGGDYPAFIIKGDGFEDLEYNTLQHACFVVSCEVIGNIYEKGETK